MRNYRGPFCPSQNNSAIDTDINFMFVLYFILVSSANFTCLLQILQQSVAYTGPDFKILQEFIDEADTGLKVNFLLIWFEKDGSLFTLTK